MAVRDALIHLSFITHSFYTRVGIRIYTYQAKLRCRRYPVDCDWPVVGCYALRQYKCVYHALYAPSSMLYCFPPSSGIKPGDRHVHLILYARLIR